MEITYNSEGLIPAIIQDSTTKTVLMLGYMNAEAVSKTLETNKVTFFSRSKQRLWTKGEESGNFLSLDSLKNDCDNDTLLIQATPHGPTCHKGTETCWGETIPTIFNYLERTIQDRLQNPTEKSYVSDLAKKGINKVAQKVGEEAVEVVIEAKDDNEELFLNETADLIFHTLVLLHFKGYKLADVERTLEQRRK